MRMRRALSVVVADALGTATGLLWAAEDAGDHGASGWTRPVQRQYRGVVVVGYGIPPTALPLGSVLQPRSLGIHCERQASSRWDSGKGRNPHKKQMRVATADDGRKFWDTSNSMIGNAAPATRLAGGNVRGPSQLKLEKVARFIRGPTHPIRGATLS